MLNKPQMWLIFSALHIFFERNVVYVRHTYFMNENLITTQKYNSFKYINMVRHPVDQFITWYYYERYGRTGVKRWQHVLDRVDAELGIRWNLWSDSDLIRSDIRVQSYKTIRFLAFWHVLAGIIPPPLSTLVLEPGTENITIDECISGGFSSCANPSQHSEFMGYFCGHDWYCFSKASNLSLEKSKNNIKNKFITIGVLEEFDSSVLLFEKILPQYFEKMLFYVKHREIGNQKTAKKEKPSKENRAFLEEKLAVEIELYEWIVERFFAQKLIHGIDWSFIWGNKGGFRT